MSTRLSVVACLVLLAAGPATMPTDPKILAAEKMAVVQLAAVGDKPPTDWTAGTLYAGLAAVDSAGCDRIGTALRWTPVPNKKDPFFADDHCVCQMFLDRYEVDHDPARLGPTVAEMDKLVDHLRATADNPKLTWWWCDALFMGPSVLAHLSAITRDPKYLDAMNHEWWRTADRLYDPAEHLFFRDERFLPSDKNKHEKVFWSRGNGWVLAGTARVLKHMSADYKDRPKYVDLFKAMADRIVGRQRPDGLVPTNLLADNSPGESSGTALDCYAVAWGINHGVLDREKYLPFVAKSWAALNRCVRPDGLLGYVQPVGDRPNKFGPDSTGLFGVGAYLLAASEAPKLAGGPAYCRYVPERLDDLAWENDRIGFRVYGPKIETEDHFSSGIDVWCKSTRFPVIDDWYARNDYHHDHGTGVDCYEVGHSRGCGGIGVWAADKLWTSRAWKSYEILDPGPDRCRFKITYAPWDANGRTVRQTSTITLDPGTNLNRIETTIDTDKPDELVIGIGVAKRTGDGRLTQSPGRLIYWEPEQKPNGSVGVAVLADPSTAAGFASDADNELMLVRVKPGVPFTYRAGACWSKGLDFHSADEWVAAVAEEGEHEGAKDAKKK